MKTFEDNQLEVLRVCEVIEKGEVKAIEKSKVKKQQQKVAKAQHVSVLTVFLAISAATMVICAKNHLPIQQTTNHLSIATSDRPMIVNTSFKADIPIDQSISLSSTQPYQQPTNHPVKQSYDQPFQQQSLLLSFGIARAVTCRSLIKIFDPGGCYIPITTISPVVV
jgi:hypothetical protein